MATKDDAPPDLSTYGGRVAHAMAYRQIPNNKLEQLADLATGEGTRIKSRTRPDFDTVQKVADVLRVSAFWLLSGKGSMELPGPGAPSPADPYPNRTIFMADDGFTKAPEAVQARIRKIANAGGDRSLREWFALLETFLALHAQGALDAADDPRAKPAQPRPKKK